MSAPPDEISELLHSIQSCMSDVKAWATVCMLKLNYDKTELMLVTSKRTKHLHNLPTSISIGNAQIPFKQSVKNLGFALDCYLTMNAHATLNYVVWHLFVDLHAVRQHLVIAHFLLLLLLSGTLFQMMSGVPHHCHHLSLI